MPIYFVLFAYGLALGTALLLLYRFEPLPWQWHLASLMVALGIGMLRLPPVLSTPEGTLAVGMVFVFLFSWGGLAPFFHRWHYHGDEHRAVGHKA